MTVLAHDAAAHPAADDPQAREAGLTVRITLEAAIIVAIVVLAGALRLAQLGHAPLNDAEAHGALAALRAVEPDAPGTEALAQSPLSYFLQAISFTVFTPGDFAARLPVALGGWLLALAPLLWRRYLGPLPALIISALLAVSPVALLASRTSSPAIWSALLAVVAPWLALRFYETRRAEWGAAATAAVAALALLAEPAGFITLFLLLFGMGFAWLSGADPDEQPGSILREVLRGWPWGSGALAAGVTVIVVGTGLMLLPGGPSVIGNGVWTGLRGFVERPDDQLAAFPLWIALRYDPAMVVFGLLACYHVIRNGGFFERTLAGWFVAGLVLSLAYQGATAAHALWITLPLTILVGLSVCRWLTETAGTLFKVPGWGVGLHAAITFGLWTAIAISVIQLGKLFMELPGTITDFGPLARELFGGIYTHDSTSGETVMVQGASVYAYVLGLMQQRLVWVILVPLAVAMLFFLVGTVWGARTAWRGTALGTLAFLLIFGVGSAGRAASLHYGDPRELWYPSPATDDIRELQDTLREMSLRTNGTPNLIPITAQADGGALAWALHDYPNTTFVNGVGPEVSTAAVITPAEQMPNDLGAAYVGKDLVLVRAWTVRALTWRDALAWVYRGDTELQPVPGQTVMLWIRSDVYGVATGTAEE
ncbi:glycosyltransferase family 39 protein [Aggregatilinea lenta]|uniref:glycosyltransferase family 39 protein n=1 Tax=Aggregatilinea lenta TaxID=913108 RepID=UPI000E5B2C93|nr:glycosyltransferase family 39 protein [Aggregatilinea lenta]